MVFPRFIALVTCFPGLASGIRLPVAMLSSAQNPCTFSRAHHWLQACSPSRNRSRFPAVSTGYVFSFFQPLSLSLSTTIWYTVFPSLATPGRPPMKFVKAKLLPISFWLSLSSGSFQNLRLKYYQEDDIINEMTLAKGTKTCKRKPRLNRRVFDSYKFPFPSILSVPSLDNARTEHLPFLRNSFKLMAMRV